MVAVEHIGTRVIEGGMVARRVGHSEGVIPVRKRKRSCWKDREVCDEHATAGRRKGGNT